MRAPSIPPPRCAPSAPQPWRAAYVQPSRRPSDGRYGDNPNRLGHYYQYQVIMKPSPDDAQALLLDSYRAIGIDPLVHDIRFVEDDWESPTLGAWGLGWEVWCDGMEIGQFTYFQQVGGIPVALPSFEMTYGLERLAMYVQGVERVYDLDFNGAGVTYGDVFLRQEREYSKYSFDCANPDLLTRQFEDAERECARLTAEQLALPGLRPVHQGEPSLQPARCQRGDLGFGASCLYRQGAEPGQGVLRDLGRRRELIFTGSRTDRVRLFDSPRNPCEAEA